MRAIWLFLLSLVSALPAHAQHTFSMVAVDTATGEIGSAGATCLSFYPMGAQINRIVPGKGVVNTQAWLSTVNRDYAASLLQKGYSAQQILDSLYARDEYPEDRQNLIIDLNGSGLRAAAYTGEYAQDYASHIVGPNYVIAGNILAGQHVLDSMENAFKRTTGSIGDKMMAALLAAKFPGADSRCLKTSSLSAFIRVAWPGDSIEKYHVDINVVSPTTDEFEPIDTLHKRYLEYKASGVWRHEREYLDIKVFPNPAKDVVNIGIGRFRQPLKLNIQIEDLSGGLVKKCYGSVLRDGSRPIRIPVADLKPGVYILDVNGQRRKLVKF